MICIRMLGGRKCLGVDWLPMWMRAMGERAGGHLVNGDYHGITARWSRFTKPSIAQATAAARYSGWLGALRPAHARM